MKIRTKVFLGYLLLILIGFFFLQDWIVDDIRKNYVESVEEMMVDASIILSSLASENIVNDTLDVSTFDNIFSKTYDRKVKAKIYQLSKERVDQKIYIADSTGTLLYHSEKPTLVGQNFAQWRDVRLTLKGKYGARTTRVVKDDPMTTVLHVGAPIYHKGAIFGSLTVCKPVTFTAKFIEYAKQKVIIQTTIISIAMGLVSLIMARWLTHPIKKLRDYARAVRDGKKAVTPNTKGKNEIAQLTRAFEQMREALEGKKYVEEYVYNLTHELKSPLSAVKGAIELLNESNLPDEQREKFTTNIQTETERMRQIVDKMLQLSLLENRKTIGKPEPFDLTVMMAGMINSYDHLAGHKKIIFQQELEEAPFSGDKLLIYQAINNLIANAIDFIPEEDGLVIMSLEKSELDYVISVADNGTGIPEYALPRLFEKFYSLPRPVTNRKSTGLGLPLVKEIIELHDGSVQLENRSEVGVNATITLPA